MLKGIIEQIGIMLKRYLDHNWDESRLIAQRAQDDAQISTLSILVRNLFVLIILFINALVIDLC